jgi:hypothetical protein
MWMAGFLPMSRGDVHTGYFDAALSDICHLKTYVCTFGAGHFVFQVVGFALHGIKRIEPQSKHFNELSVPFWPRIQEGFIWPGANVLRTVSDFDSFSMRWRDVDAVF